MTALELLIEQWDYSMSLLAGGRAFEPIADPGVRDALLRDAAPHLRALYERGEMWVPKMRDAAYHLRGVATDAGVRALYDDVLHDWLTNHWEPCRVGGGVLGVGQVVEALGPERSLPTLVPVILESPADRVLCLARDTANVEWIRSSDLMARAWVTRWASGNVPENEQLRFEFLEHMLSTSGAPEMRAWMFARLEDRDTPALYKNAILDAATRNPRVSDLGAFTRLLSVPSYTRWAAMQALVDSGGTQGLEHVLQNLPADGEYRFYDGVLREDGFQSAARNIACAIPKLGELGDNARRVFERYIDSPNVPARVLSVTCLERFGDRQSLARLRAVRSAMGRSAPPAVGFGPDATVADVIDRAIAAIEARIAG